MKRELGTFEPLPDHPQQTKRCQCMSMKPPSRKFLRCGKEAVSLYRRWGSVIAICEGHAEWFRRQDEEWAAA